MSRRESDAIRQGRTPRLALILLEGDRFIGQRTDVISPKQPRNCKPQLSLCDVDSRTYATAPAPIQNGKGRELKEYQRRSPMTADTGGILFIRTQRQMPNGPGPSRWASCSSRRTSMCRICPAIHVAERELWLAISRL